MYHSTFYPELTLSDFVLSYRPPIGFAAARIEVLAFSDA